MHKATLILAAVLFGNASAALATNIVKNPGFEAGKADWSVTGTFRFDPDPSLVHDGLGAAITGCSGSKCLKGPGTGFFISQELPTLPGETYDLSFWTRSVEGTGTYAVFWNGIRVADGFSPAGPMVMQEYDKLLATSALTMLEIHGRNDPSLIVFDDFVVERSGMRSLPGVPMVPEPMNWVMLAAGLSLLTVAVRKR